MLKELIKEILKEEITGKAQNDCKTDLSSKFCGKICMVRTYSAGVHFGELVEKVGQQAILKNARRVFYWTQACSLSQLAMEGSKDIENCKITMAVDEILLDRVIEVIPMSEVAKTQMQGAPVWKK